MPGPLDEEEQAPHPVLGRGSALFLATIIILTQFVQMIPYGAGINAALSIGEDLGANPIQATWIAAAYPLTQGAFIPVAGRFGAIFGHKNTLLVAGIWWVIFSLVSGFTRNFIALCVMRALTGIGGAFMVPNSIALLTMTFPPGKFRNITVSLFGAMAPIGAAGGSVLPGFFTQLLPWKWLFFFLAMLGAVIFTLFFFFVPSEGEPVDKGGKFDWVGGYLGTTGLILFNFVWNQAAAVGWEEPYEYILLITSLAHLAGFVIWEWKFASVPILPFDIWVAPSFGPMITAFFSTFMAVGIAIWYISIWNITLKGYTNLLNGASFSTLAVCGAVAAIASGILIRKIPAQVIMAIGSVASAVSLILIATQSERQIYWAQTFPALIIVALGPDFIFTAAQIIASNSVKRKHQGAAGSLIGTLASYGLSTGLGFASTVEVYTNDGGKNIIAGYRHALYFGIGLAAIATVIALFFVRIPKDSKKGWDEDDFPTTEQMEKRVAETQQAS